MTNDVTNEQNLTNPQKTNVATPDIKEQKKLRFRIVTPTAHPLPHSSSNIEQHLKIIKAYFIATNEGKKAVMYKDFEHFGLDFHYNYVSANNKFLQELGLIESSGQHGMYIPTKNAIEFQRYTDWGQKEKALDILRQLVEGSWFWESAKQVLLMQDEGTDENDLLNKLGADAKANREKHIGSLKILLSYLEYVGLVMHDEKTNKLKMALVFIPKGSSPINRDKDDRIQISETNEKLLVNSQLPLSPQNTQPTETIHYREEPGHFTLRVKLDETSIQLLEEEIKYIKGKHALLQKSKTGD